MTGTATINAVGVGAFINYDGENPSNASAIAKAYAYITLTDSTTITATRKNSVTDTIVIYGTITDGDTTNLISGTNGVQYGTVTIASTATSGTASISAVTNSNTALHLLGFDDNTLSTSARAEFAVLSLSGTTITATVPAASSGAVYGFVAINFQGFALNQSVQNYSITSSSGVTSFSVTGLNAVVAANAMNFYAGSSIALVTTELAQAKMYGSLASTTSVQVNVNTSSATAKIYNGTLIEFIAGLLNSSVQRGTTTVTGSTSNYSTITSVNTSYAISNFLGNTTSSLSADATEAEFAIQLTAGDTITSTKNSSAGNGTTSWEIVEFQQFTSASNALFLLQFMLSGLQIGGPFFANPIG